MLDEFTAVSLSETVAHGGVVVARFMAWSAVKSLARAAAVSGRPAGAVMSVSVVSGGDGAG